MRRIVLIASMVATAPGALPGQVSYERLVRASEEPHNWLTYSGSYSSERYSPLKEINRNTVSDLQVKWVYQMRNPGLVETTPLVVGDVMYLTEPPSTVTALDVHTGRRIWTWSPSLPPGVLAIGFPRVNRGVAVLDETVYVGTLNAHLVALDAGSGTVRWDVEVADNSVGFAITAAPLAIDGKVVIGVGAEAGIRGFVDA